jgi:hypothetical protein
MFTSLGAVLPAAVTINAEIRDEIASGQSPFA